MLPPDEPHVRVTLENIYATLLEVKQTLTQVLTENQARDRQVDRHEQDIAAVKADVGQLKEERATRSELDELRASQTSKNRWAIGTTLTCVGLALAVLGIVARIRFGG